MNEELNKAFEKFSKEYTPPTKEAIAKIKSVREKYETELLAYENVVGVSTGLNVKNMEPIEELAIQVLVEKKVEEKDLRKALPKKIDSIPLDVLETGKLEIQPLTAMIRPSKPGFSLGHFEITAGTFGALVNDVMSGQMYILSNNHVLANSNLAALGDPILQPGRADGGTFPSSKIATLERFVEIIPTNQSPGYNLVDAAIATPDDSRLAVADAHILGIPDGIGEAQIGSRVTKVGRTTDHTIGTVMNIDATVIVGGFGVIGAAQFRNQIITTAMSAGGDSGSLTRDLDGKAVGLLFAGSPAVTIHNDITNVMQALNVKLATAG